MTDVTREFFCHLGRKVDSAAKRTEEHKRPYETEVKQLAAVVRKLDLISVNAIRSPESLLRGWHQGICKISEDFTGTTTIREKVQLDEIKAVLDLIQQSIDASAEQMYRQQELVRSQEEKSANRLFSWRWLIFGDDSTPDAHELAHLRGMRETMELFLADVRDLVKMCEVKQLRAEVREKEILNTWRSLPEALLAQKSRETESAANYAAAVAAKRQELSTYKQKPVVLDPEGEKQVESLVRSTIPRPQQPRDVLPHINDEIERKGYISVPDYSPEESEVLGQANPVIQQLRITQQRDDMEEEYVLEISRKVERISELLNFLATEVDHQHAMSANILVVTNSAISNVSSAQEELEKALNRKVSFCFIGRRHFEERGLFHILMWRKVFRSRSAGGKLVDELRHEETPSYIDGDDNSTVGSIDSIICMPPIPPDMTEPTKAGHRSPVQKNVRESASRQIATRPHRVFRSSDKTTFRLIDFDLIRTVGTGSFGRVYLAKPKAKDRSKVQQTKAPFIPSSNESSSASSKRQPVSTDSTASDGSREFVALKRLSKNAVVEMKQVHHVQSEKEILESINHPFLVRLLGTFQDMRYLYIVMEFVEGGEFFNFLRKSKRLNDDDARFYAAHIVLIFEYLHDRCVVYRDLKPENLLITRRGYLKLTDFGFAKYLINRTYTLCGTPEYIAPEVNGEQRTLSPQVLLNKGHGFQVDWWALGVLIYEMLVGYPPFFDEDALCIYQKILRGKIIFPRLFPKDAKSLVKHLLCHDLGRRLGHVKEGMSDVRHHRWFSALSFTKLLSQYLPPPYIPPDDQQAFGEYAEDDTQAPIPSYDPFADW